MMCQLYPIYNQGILLSIPILVFLWQKNSLPA